MTKKSLFSFFWMCYVIFISMMLIVHLGFTWNIATKKEENLKEKNQKIVIESEKQMNEIQQLKKENTALKKENQNYKNENEALKKELNDLKLANNVKKEDGIYVGNQNSDKIANLTFDDGPSKNTEKILSILNHYNIKASFFVNGNESELGTEMYKKIVANGHTLGNHTYSHDYSYIYQSVENFDEDFNKMDNKITALTGIKTKYIRFPGGSNNHISYRYGGKKIMPQIEKEMINKGYVYYDWNVDSGDASAKLVKKEKLIRNVLNGAKNKKNITVLMHDTNAKSTTPEALPTIIEGLKKQGFTFEPITEKSLIVQFQRP